MAVGILTIALSGFSYSKENKPDNINVYLIQEDNILPVTIDEIHIIHPRFEHIQDTLNSNDLLIWAETGGSNNRLYSFKINNLSWSSPSPHHYILIENKPLSVFEVGLKVHSSVDSVSETYFFTGDFIKNKTLQPYHVIIGVMAIVLMIITFFFHRFYRKRDMLEHVLNEKTNELLAEKEKTEKLLSNLLPKGTADELRSKGRADTKKYELATVLFCDIQGFTKIAEEMNPEIMVDMLDSFFFHFDSVVEKLNIEKIKTIGDAYMCAGGIPQKNTTNPVEVVLAALEMLDYMMNLQEEQKIWELRVGIHTGPLIAGVVGQKRLSYDIWGDTVNTASRMESSGEAGKINISGQTYKLVKDYFICEYRGKMPVKYKGRIDMYFVKGIRPGLSETNIYKPNKEFLVKLQFLRLNDLESEVYTILEVFNDLNLPYHNLKHTIDIYTKAELYAHSEQLSSEEILLVKTAALLYDLYMIDKLNYIDNQNYKPIHLLTEFKYSEKQKEIVFRLFLRLDKPLLPQSEMEKVFVDAEFDYFGRMDFKDIIRNRLDELDLHPASNGHNKAKKDLLEVFEFYDFHTETAKQLREVKKAKQIQVLKSMLSEIK